MYRLKTSLLPLRLAACVACAVAVVAISNAAEARPRHHHAQPHAHQVSHHHHAHKRHHVRRHRVRGARHAARWKAFRAQAQTSNANASLGGESSFGGGFGGSNLVAEARRYIGGNPTGRSRLWCARFMNMVLQRTGHSGTGSDMASSFAKYGRRISGPQVGAIAVMSRGRRGGHVGVVSGIDAKGNPIIISGNHGRRVAEAPYSRGRIYAYVMPAS